MQENIHDLSSEMQAQKTESCFNALNLNIYTDSSFDSNIPRVLQIVYMIGLCFLGESFHFLQPYLRCLRREK